MDLSTVPDPGQNDTGVAGDQQPGAPDDILPTPPPLEGELLPRTVIRLIEGSPHHYGGDQLGPVIAAIISDAQHDKEQARKQVAAIQTQLDKANADLVEQKLRNVTLEERVRASSVRSRFEKFLIFCSPIAFSFALDLYKASSILWLPLAVFGLALLAVNFWPSKGNNS
ncbi:hypothetical protein [Pseudomonas sp. EA_65y_Pfl2_P78]|uniref:hypothetical protein n=1 Tax=Pseudomonas sp. EA_65y_Pfl2_P78 TaxID=3088695 RepID=UPI0030DD01F9